MPAPRRKTCVQCRTAKSRCSLSTPCMRCRNRDLPCKYEDVVSRNKSHSLRTPRPIAPAFRTSSGFLGSGLADGSVDVQELEHVRELFAPADPLGESAAARINWELFDSSVPSLSNNATGGSVWNPLIAMEDQDQAPLPASATLDSTVEHISRGEITLSWLTQDFQEVPTDNSLSHNTSLTSKYQRYSHKLLWPRMTPTIKGYFSNTVLLGQVMSYPQMMCRGIRLPPFIFPRCILGGPVAFDCEAQGAHMCLPEILAVCSSMVDLFERRTPANSGFVWRTIYAEHSRLRREFASYGTERQLEAVQAIVIYILLQAQDIDSIERNNAKLLAETLTDIGTAVYMKLEHIVVTSPVGISRKDWMLKESGIRTVCIIYVIQLLLDIIFTPNSPKTCGAFGECLVPCVRDLWEPVSNREWSKRHNEFYPRGESSGVVLNFDTIRATAYTEEISEVNTRAFAEVSRWCSRLDDLGMLVWTLVVSKGSTISY